MSEDILLTIMQISDLHFGDKAAGYTGSELSAKLPPFIAKSEMFDGWLGHHWQGISDLHRFYCELWGRTNGNVRVIVSGDLTACGSVAQFKLADAFLGAQKGSQLPFGLGLADWHNNSVSGNHDQWPGSNCVLGYPTSGLRMFLPGPYPRVEPRIKLNADISIRFLFIDSDADVHPMFADRLLARGKFVSQLKALHHLVPEREVDEIRVLVVHHSVSPVGSPQVNHTELFPRPTSRIRNRLEIDRGTLRVLEHALVDLDIQVVCTGHLHIPRLGQFTASNDLQTTQVLEARCGTTTQLDRYPYEVLGKIPYKRILPPNTLICHEIIKRGGGLFWRAKVYWRAKGRGFVHDELHASIYLPPSLLREFKLVV